MTPTMADIHHKLVQKYAKLWRLLGLELGLKDYDIDNISEQNVHHPRKLKMCFIAMLKQWLINFPSATWGTLEDAINKLRFSRSASDSYTSTYVRS